MLMRLGIGANAFDLKESDAHLFRDLSIGPARNLDGVDRVGNYRLTQAKIVGGDTIDHHITSRSDVRAWIHDAGRPDSLFDRIDSQIDRVDLVRQVLSDRAFRTSCASERKNINPRYSYARLQPGARSQQRSSERSSVR